MFLALAAQFESFRDPFVILLSVPMALFGALMFVNPLMTLNIYTKVGLVTLVGLISKHGILIVQFANELQRSKGLTKRQAIEEAAGVRLRPILMTTAAMVLGVLAAGNCLGCRRCGSQEHGYRDLYRPVDRHRVYPVCGAGLVSVPWRRSPRGEEKPSGNGS